MLIEIEPDDPKSCSGCPLLIFGWNPAQSHEEWRCRMNRFSAHPPGVGHAPPVRPLTGADGPLTTEENPVEVPSMEMRCFTHPPLLGPELQAIHILNELLSDLKLGERRRILAYANDKHGE